jgi:membrane associated rhomboid family serine protease
MLIPTGHENMRARRWPLITIGLILINLAAFLLTISTLDTESPQLTETRVHIRLLAAMHPELNLPPAALQLVDDIRRREPATWAAAQDPHRQLQDVWDARIRLMEDPAALQQEMDNLSARYADMRSHSVLERYAFVPAHPTWYSYVTANFLHGGWLHIIGNMWFLWLAGIVLEDVWGRPLFLAVYLIGGAFALQVHAWWNPGSNVATVGASGAVAALMGAFLVRFPKVRIHMRWFWGLARSAKFSAEAYWLLPLWFAMEIFSGVLFGAHSGVAHMAHVGGFCLGVLAAFAIHWSGLEHTINQKIEAELDPNNDAQLDRVHELMCRGSLDDALIELEQHRATNAASERALLLCQEIHWRKNQIPAYIEATQQLCVFHLTLHADEQAIKDYEELVRVGAPQLPDDAQFRLCQAFEQRQEYERALTQYQEFASAHAKSRQGLMAQLAAARVAANKLQRTQLALDLYQALLASPVPHLDLEASVQSAMGDLRITLTRSARQEAAPSAGEIPSQSAAESLG